MVTMKSIRCRLGMHKWAGDGEYVRDDSIARASGCIAVIEAGYYRCWCARCERASDAERATGRENGSER